MKRAIPSDQPNKHWDGKQFPQLGLAGEREAPRGRAVRECMAVEQWEGAEA
jgi:hypothetical protein